MTDPEKIEDPWHQIRTGLRLDPVSNRAVADDDLDRAWMVATADPEDVWLTAGLAAQLGLPDARPHGLRLPLEAVFGVTSLPTIRELLSRPAGVGTVGLEHQIDLRRSDGRIVASRCRIRALKPRSGEITHILGLSGELGETDGPRQAEGSEPTAGLVHEFNNTLAVIVPALELALHKNEDPDVGRLLGIAYNAALKGAALTAEPEDAEPDWVNGAGRSVLLVEDEADLRASLSEILVTLGYKVSVMATGDDALAHFIGGARFDILFTDIELPGGLNGFELAEGVRRLAPETALVYISGYASGGRQAPPSAPGEILQKPCSIAAVSDALARAVGRMSGF